MKSNFKFKYLHANFANHLPVELPKLNQWITWQAGPVKSDGKFDKFPHGRDGTGNQWQKPHQWMSFDEAVETAKQRGHSGIGIVLPATMSDGSHLIALDFDTVDLNQSQSNPRLDEIQTLHEQLNFPYIEASPSGKGIRMFVKSAVLIPQVTCPNPLGGKDELFCASGKWVTVTGNKLGGSGVPLVTKEIVDIAAKWEALSGVKASKPTVTSPSGLNLGQSTKGWTGWPVNKIRDGDGREEIMLAYAGYLRGKGHDQVDIERLCLEANNLYYEDKLDEDVVLDRSRRYEIASEVTPPEPPSEIGNNNEPNLLDQIDHTDAGNVAVLHNLVGVNIRYVHQFKIWIVWIQTRWQFDAGGTYLYKQMLKVSKFHKKQGDKFSNDAESAGSADQAKHLREASKASVNWSKQCRNKTRIGPMKALAELDSRFSLDANEIDSDPWLLGVQNGVVDLRTGILHPDAKSQFVIKRCSVNYDPTAQADRWGQFTDEITSMPDGLENGMVKAKLRPHLVHYLQKVLGYCLTGKVNEHLMFIAIGKGSNGKNVLLDTVQAIMYEYCQTIPPEVLMTSKYENGGEQASPNLKKLAGARCGISSENKEGQRLDIAIVKRHTGGGTMTARALHENPITFLITHKLWLMTNKTPQLNHLDDAIKGRLHLIPFDMKWNRPGEVNPDPTIPNADKALMDTLRAEYEGILAWLVRGAVKYYSEGLQPPKEVAAFTQDYIAAQDMFRRWLSDEVESCPVADGLLATELFESYDAYCKSEDEKPQIVNKSALGKRLSALGISGKKEKLGKRYGLKAKVKTDEPEDVGEPTPYDDMTAEEIESMLLDQQIDDLRLENALKR